MNPEQFALAMWLIQQKQAGKDPPAALTPDMVPPSMRAKTQIQVCLPCNLSNSLIVYLLIVKIKLDCR